MKTTSCIKSSIFNHSISTVASLSGRKGNSGYVTKTALVALVLVGLAAAGFVLRVKGKTLSESVLPALSQVQNSLSPAEEVSPMPTATPGPGEVPQAISAVAPTANTLPAPAKAVKPTE